MNFPNSEAGPDREAERVLVEAAQADPEAFGALYQAYFDRLYGYVKYRVRQAEEAEDLVGRVFEEAWRSLASFTWREGAGFGSWLFRIAHNRIIDQARSRRGRVQVGAEALEAQAHDGPDPQAAWAQGRLAETLRGLVDRLPGQQRDTVALRYFSGLKNKEIAEVLKVGEKTVASNLCRALATLEKWLQAEGLTLDD